MDEPRDDDLGGGPGRPDIGDGEPSTVFVFWNDAEVPLQEEVRLALVAAFPDLAFPDEHLETDEDVLWAFVARNPERGFESVIWCEGREGPFDEQLEQGLSGAALSAARACKWWIGIESWLDLARGADGYQLQLQLAAAAAIPGFLAAYDETAGRVFGEFEVRDLIACPVPPRTRHLYSIQRLQGAGGTWLCTYGMSRLGLPELDLPAVPGDALGTGYELLEAVADGLAEGREPDGQGYLELGENMKVRALAPDAAMNIMEPALASMLSDRQPSGTRLVLLDTGRALPPLRLLGRGTSGGGRALYKSVSETRRMRSLALARWGTFGQLFAMHQREDWHFHVKLSHGRRGAAEVREHLWFEVLALRPGMIEGRLLSRPVDVQGLEVGAVSWQSLDRLTDWLIQCPKGTFDPERAPRLLAD